MADIVLTPPYKLQQLIRRELENFFKIAKPHTRVKGDKILSLSEAAKLLNLEEQELKFKAIDEEIPHYRFGKEYVFVKSELEALNAA